MSANVIRNGLILLLLLAFSCGSEGIQVDLDAKPGEENAESIVDSSPVPSAAELETALMAELNRLGIDQEKGAAAAPTAGNEVIDLAVELLDPDGSGPDPATGFSLSWTERLVGDYDQNAEVNLADVSGLALNWQQYVLYEDPITHGGFSSYPVGDPEYDGGAEPGSPPIVDSGAYNWRLSRVDGDGNGEINLADVTPIALHFRERLDGYRIYRRGPGDTAFSLLESEGDPVFVGRGMVNGGAGVDPSRPVRFEYQDLFAVDGEYEYRVVPFDGESGLEGPPSVPGFDVLGAVTAVISADPTQGAPPLVVQFNASASTTLKGTITDYSWDLDGDSILEEFTGEVPVITREYNVYGSWLASVQVTNSEGDTGVASVVVSVTRPPVAKLDYEPDWLEAPLVVTFDASASSDPDGEVVGFEWDMDNDGDYELDTGPLPVHKAEFPDPGEFTVGVRVTDNLGATASTTLTISLRDDYVEQEDNDSFSTGMDLGLLADGSMVSGLTGSIGSGLYDGDDADWFRFQLGGAAVISANLVFSNGDADLNLGLYGPDSLQAISLAQSLTDNEELSAPALIAGEYYVLVSRQPAGGAAAGYNLDLAIGSLEYDEQEDNDSPAQAQPLGNIDAGLVPQFVGSLGPGGYDGDSDDWISFQIGNPGTYAIGLEFFHRAADLEMQLYTAGGGSLLASASTVSDNELLVTELAAGEYVIRCFRFDGGSADYILSILFE